MEKFFRLPACFENDDFCGVRQTTRDERNEWIDKKGTECRTQFELNKRLISFKEIPSELIDNVYTKYKFIY